jgi:hypothetical protein
VTPARPNEKDALFGVLTSQREHIFDALEGLGVRDLERPVLPSGWTCIGLVNHLSMDVERFWFQAVIAGERHAVEEVLASSDNAWEASPADSAAAALQGYRDNIDRGDAIAAGCSLDAEPQWWPDFFGSWRLHTVREIVLHVVTETATHAGHLDAARELIDGKQHLVLSK